MRKISADNLYYQYRSQGYSHLDAIRKVIADMRQIELSRLLNL